MTELHPLKPFLPSKATLLMLGSFPPPKARWTMDFYYPNFQNDMWRIFGMIFFNDKDYFVINDNKKFDEQKIRKFLTEKGIALYDTASAVVRLKNNASDKFLEIAEPTDLKALLSQIPLCRTIVTTGQKATETLMSIIGLKETPPLGSFLETYYDGRKIRCYRMPSSSRAYPKLLAGKVADYRKMFMECLSGL